MKNLRTCVLVFVVGLFAVIGIQPALASGRLLVTLPQDPNAGSGGNH